MRPVVEGPADRDLHQPAILPETADARRRVVDVAHPDAMEVGVVIHERRVVAEAERLDDAKGLRAERPVRRPESDGRMPPAARVSDSIERSSAARCASASTVARSSWSQPWQASS